VLQSSSIIQTASKAAQKLQST